MKCGPSKSRCSQLQGNRNGCGPQSCGKCGVFPMRGHACMRPDGISIDKRDWEKINAGKITYAQMLATKV